MLDSGVGASKGFGVHVCRAKCVGLALEVVHVLLRMSQLFSFVPGQDWAGSKEHGGTLPEVAKVVTTHF